MIGIDRPIRSEWIHQILKIMEPGQKLSDYNASFENIAKQLLGKEGKKKARTVIFRSFIHSVQTNTKTVEDSYFIQLAKEHGEAMLRPVFFLKLLMDYEILRQSIKKIFLLEQGNGLFSPDLLKKQIVRSFGDRDVVKRSANACLSTMVHFKLLAKNGKHYALIRQSALSETQSLFFIEMYSRFYLHSESVDLNAIDDVFNLIYPLDNMNRILNQHPERWEHIRDRGRNILLMKRCG